MGERYTRRQNTNWWEVHLNRIIDRGEKLKEEKDFRQFQGVLDYQKKIEDWLERAASDIRRVYENQGLAAEYCPPLSKIDFENVSWLEAMKFFRDSISERIEGLKNLISKADR